MKRFLKYARAAALAFPLAATVAGADGVLIEVHNDPAHALCDGPQSITPSEFGKLSLRLESLHAMAFQKGELQ